MKAILLVLSLFVGMTLFTGCVLDDDRTHTEAPAIDLAELQGNWIEVDHACLQGWGGLEDALFGVVVTPAAEAHAYAHIKHVSPSPAVHLGKIPAKNVKLIGNDIQIKFGGCTYLLKKY